MLKLKNCLNYHIMKKNLLLIGLSLLFSLTLHAQSQDSIGIQSVVLMDSMNNPFSFFPVGVNVKFKVTYKNTSLNTIFLDSLKLRINFPLNNNLSDTLIHTPTGTTLVNIPPNDTISLEYPYFTSPNQFGGGGSGGVIVVVWPYVPNQATPFKMGGPYTLTYYYSEILPFDISSIKVFPNPCTVAHLSIANPAEIPIQSIRIFDTKGQEIPMETPHFASEIPVGHLRSGLYFLHILTESGHTLISCFQKQ